MESFERKLNARIEAAKAEVSRAIRVANLHMLITQTLDQRPAIEVGEETSISIYIWHDDLDATIFYITPSIPAILPVLEYFERVFGAEFTSEDSSSGARRFNLNVPALDFTLTLSVAPDEAAPEATCRKVIVGEHVETQTIRTPTYKLICD